MPFILLSFRLRRVRMPSRCCRIKRATGGSGSTMWIHNNRWTISNNFPLFTRLVRANVQQKTLFFFPSPHVNNREETFHICNDFINEQAFPVDSSPRVNCQRVRYRPATFLCEQHMVIRVMCIYIETTHCFSMTTYISSIALDSTRKKKELPINILLAIEYRITRCLRRDACRSWRIMYFLFEKILGRCISIRKLLGLVIEACQK